MALIGSSVNDPNYVLRFSVIVFMGIMAFGSVLFWRSQLLFTADYQEMPLTHEQIRIKKENTQKQQSIQNKLLKNYQLAE